MLKIYISFVEAKTLFKIMVAPYVQNRIHRMHVLQTYVVIQKSS